MDRTNRGVGSMDTLLHNYKLGKTLGHGSFGKVKIAEHISTGYKVAVKILNRRKLKNPEMEEKVRREIKICRLFVHPHIIRLYEVIETPLDIYVVMEYVKSGELFDYIVEKGRLHENEARKIFQQIISGVEYCHRNMVVHRDLKPENILLDSRGNVKVADFGLSNIMRDGHFLKTSCGSPNYAAPEVVSGKLYAGPEVDVWSCGVILYALLCGTLPFDDENIPNLFKKIKLDEEIMKKVINMGFDRNHLTQSLHSRIQDDATVAYYLLFDNQSRVAGGYLGAEVSEPLEGDLANMHLDNVPNRFTRDTSFKTNFPSERKWNVGLQIPANPRDIMTRVLEVLRDLNVCWKKIGLYNIKCRWVYSSEPITSDHYENHYMDSAITPNNVQSQSIVKFEIQLYKTPEDSYLVDVQKINGPQLLFLDFCAALILQLETGFF